MYVINGIVHASNPQEGHTIADVQILDRLYMLVTFTTGERRVFDVEPLVSLPAFAPLKDDAVFRTAEVTDGILTWQSGTIDIGPDEVYRRSYAYPDKDSSIA